MPADLRRVKDLFVAALDFPDPAERAAFLDRECGSDAELRHRVAVLLATHEQLELVTVDHDARLPPTLDATRAPAVGGDASVAIGVLLAGKYKLTELIGEGGMGSVWLAQQSEPVKRQVAVKLIKPGMDSRQVLARFEAERQALAMMDHPNIAKVLDGGLHENRPYFVMELVKGVPITEYCDERKLTPKERLELFIPVCQAIQHAHQKGIIHRDIKPNNVLVALYDDRPVPKVIDFGVAKATGQQFTEFSIDTGLGGVVGTPQYMSPEQATLNNLDIDTRSDVYSLGVLLYELLTGSPPFSQKELAKKGLMEILRVVREEEPPKPSTKLSTADALPSLSANRGTEPKKLTALLRSELDWIVLKALEKDRTRRYETASGFAADVQRYLMGEPVHAHPPSRSYRLRKFLRKNRGPVVAASLVALALIAGVIGTSFGLLQAREQTRIAVEEAGAKEEARRNEAEQRELAELANQQAFDALKSFTDELMGKLLGGKDKLTDTDKAILHNALKQWEVFAQSKGQSPLARDIRAQGLTEVALIQQKLGLTTEAEANHRKSLELRAGLAAELPAVPLYRKKHGMGHQNLGMTLRAVYGRLVDDLPDVAEYRSRLSESTISLGNSVRDRGDLAKAEEHYRTALSHQQKLVADHPDVADYRWSVARSHWGLAFTKKRLEQIAESEGHYRIALTTYQELARRRPEVLEYRRDLGGLHRELGVMLTDSGDHEKGESEFPPALAYQSQLVAEFPSIPTYRAEQARTHRDYGKVLRLLKKRTEAEAQFGNAEALLEKLVADNPTVLPYQADLGLTYLFHGDVYDSAVNRPTSLVWYEKAVRTLTTAHLTDPSQILIKYSLANSYAGRAAALGELNHPVEALKDWDKAVELAPANRLASYRARRVGALRQAGRALDALAEVTELTKTANWTARDWYDFACVYGVASRQQPDYADPAMNLLHKAAKAGFTDAARLKQDADLDALRGRADFQKLLAERENRPEVAPPPRQLTPTKEPPCV